jgi:hypothetical protein
MNYYSKYTGEEIESLLDSTDIFLENYKTILIDTIYPVGSIYMSTNNTEPSVIFGLGE